MSADLPEAIGSPELALLFPKEIAFSRLRKGSLAYYLRAMLRRMLPALTLALVLALGLDAPATAAPSKKSSTSAAAKSGTAAKKKSSAAATRSKAKASPPREAPTQYLPNGVPIVRAASVLLLDARTGEILYEKNADQPRPPASTQKLLTALLVVESGNLHQSVTIEPSDTWAEPVKLNIQPGEVYSRYDLLEVLLVHSMNDVACALARDNAGSVEAFAARMNQKALQLGATSSNFVNPNGLPAPGQFSTARDMARIAIAAYHNRTIRTIVRQKEMYFRYNDGRVRHFDNTNKVLKAFPHCNGMKTGYTQAAGRCLISSASNGEREVIAVLLGDDRNIWKDSHAMLAYGLSVNTTPRIGAASSY